MDICVDELYIWQCLLLGDKESCKCMFVHFSSQPFLSLLHVVQNTPPSLVMIYFLLFRAIHSIARNVKWSSREFTVVAQSNIVSVWSVHVRVVYCVAWTEKYKSSQALGLSVFKSASFISLSLSLLFLFYITTKYLMVNSSNNYHFHHLFDW